MNSVNGTRYVFMSYSTKDLAFVQELTTELGARQVPVYLAKGNSDLQGRNFLEVIEGKLKGATVVAVCIGAGGLGDFQRVEVTRAVILAAKKGLRVFPIQIPGAEQVAELELFMSIFDGVDLRDGLESHRLDLLADSFKACLGSAKADGELTLSAILKRTKKRLLIAGHTLDRFTRDHDVREELMSLALQGKNITILQLNPGSPYARAHQPFHGLESGSSADNQYDQTISFFEHLFHLLGRQKQCSMDVSFSNYMPRFRTIIVDETVYIYLYMYGTDVGNTPDLCLEPSAKPDDLLRRRILYSTLSAVKAPESIPFIRLGQIFPYWHKTHVSKWPEWTTAERTRHQLTHEFYYAQAEVFDARYGLLLEDYVVKHLDQTKGSTLVLGCGSGKEVEYLGKRGDYVCGVDSSYVAIKKARERCPDGNFILGDFYDLDVPEFLDGREFDSVVANAAFVHLLNREDIDDVLCKIWSRLRDGGVLFLRCLYKELAGQPLMEEKDQWGPRWFVYYSQSELACRCRAAGFDVDLRTTDAIFDSCHWNLTIAREKGAKHVQYPDIYWSCVLARKHGNHGS